MVPFFESTELRSHSFAGKRIMSGRRFWNVRSAAIGLFLVGSTCWGWHFTTELAAARRETDGGDDRCVVARFIWPDDTAPNSESALPTGSRGTSDLVLESERNHQSTLNHRSTTTIRQAAESRQRHWPAREPRRHDADISAESADPFASEQLSDSYTVRVSATGDSVAAAIDAPSMLPVQRIHASATIVGQQNSAALLNGQLVVKGRTFSVDGAEYRLLAVEPGAVVVGRGGDEFRINVEPVTRTASKPDSSAAVFR